MPDQSTQTLAELLSRRAREDGERLAYAFLADGLAVADRLTFAGLEASARAIAGHLLQRVAPGECVLLMYDAGLDFVSALFGCFYAGVVAVPLPALEASRMRSGASAWKWLSSIAKPDYCWEMRAPSLLQTALQEPMGIDEASWIDTHEWALVAQPANLPATAMDSIAYLQYTSGSTRTPRGVMISHANITHHLGAMQKALGYDPDSVSVCWMPHFHDYGLVEGVLLPFFNGTPSYLMSPFTFLKRPAVWLEAIGRYRGTHTQAFNYAYRYCARRISPARREATHLTTLSLPVTAESLSSGKPSRNSTRHSPDCGLRRQALNPVFGLAEATLLVTANSARGRTRYQRASIPPPWRDRGSCRLTAKTAVQPRIPWAACGGPLPGREAQNRRSWGNDVSGAPTAAAEWRDLGFVSRRSPSATWAVSKRARPLSASASKAKPTVEPIYERVISDFCMTASFTFRLGLRI